MKRIIVVGCSGSGKTTLAKRLVRELRLPYVELDAAYHQAGWVPLETGELRRRVDATLHDATGWVVDGNFNEEVGTRLQSRADTIVWIDLPRRIVMGRVIWLANRATVRHA